MSSAASQPEEERGTGVSVVPLVPVWRVDRRFDYALPAKLQAVVQVGSLVRVPFGNRRVRAVVTSLMPTAPEGLEEVAALVAGAPVAPGRLIEVFEWLAHRYVAPLGRAFERAVPPRVRMKVASPEPLDTALAGGERRLLSYAGGAELLRALQSEEGSNWSVRTLSGEDHGALVVEMIDAALSEGGQALVAVPEVRWGSATLERLSERWPQTARVDSAQPDGDRARAWLRIGAGAPLGAGGRSTVLAPADQLRLIVVDDEHHVSYKEDRSPRYDARKVALERARLQGASCVFVSPTPSVEVGAAVRDGDFREVIPGREDVRSARPIVETVAPPSDRVFSHELHERIRDTLKDGDRVALLVPARIRTRDVVHDLPPVGSMSGLRIRAVLRSRRGRRAVLPLRLPRTGPLIVPQLRLAGVPLRWRRLGEAERTAEQVFSTRDRGPDGPRCDRRHRSASGRGRHLRDYMDRHQAGTKTSRSSRCGARRRFIVTAPRLPGRREHLPGTCGDVGMGGPRIAGRTAGGSDRRAGAPRDAGRRAGRLWLLARA